MILSFFLDRIAWFIRGKQRGPSLSWFRFRSGHQVSQSSVCSGCGQNPYSSWQETCAQAQPCAGLQTTVVISPQPWTFLRLWESSKHYTRITCQTRSPLWTFLLLNRRGNWVSDRMSSLCKVSELLHKARIWIWNTHCPLKKMCSLPIYSRRWEHLETWTFSIPFLPNVSLGGGGWGGRRL